MNKAIISGNLTGDPEIRETTTGREVATIVVACNGPTKKDGSKDTDFIRCILWDKKAEFAKRWLFKGQPVLVEGRISVRKYEHNGENRTATEIVVSNIEPQRWPDKSDSQPRFAESDENMF